MLSALALVTATFSSGTTLEGVFSIEHACTPVAHQGASLECHSRFVIQPDGLRKVQIDFEPEIAQSMSPNWRMIGKKLSVEGFYEDENHSRFHVTHACFRPDGAKVRTSLGPQSAAKPYVTILVRFSDKTAITPQPRDWYVDLFSASYPRLGHYFSDQSSGAMTIAGSAVVGWFNLPHPLSYYQTAAFPNLDGEKLFADSVALADPTVDFTKFEGINIIMNTDFGGSAAGFASYQTAILDGRNIQWPTTMNTPSGAWLALLAHEMGHTMGFDHSSGAYPDEAYDSRWDVMSGGDGPMQQDSKYGGVPVGYNAYHRQDVGWLPSNRVFYAMPGTNQTIRVEQLNSPTASGYLSAIVFRGSGSQYFTIESRRRVSYDQSAPGDAVIIHECDRNRLSYDSRYGTTVPDRRSQVVDPDNDGDPNDWNETEPKVNAQWTVGETYTDGTTGIQIQVVSAGATYFNVKIIVPATLNAPNQVIKTADNGIGTLRGALDFATFFPELPQSKNIDFRIPTTDPNYSGGVFRIAPVTPFNPIAAQGMAIDGTTQTAFGGNTNTSGPEVEIDGTNAGQYANAFRIETTGVTVRGLAVNSFNGASLWINGPNGGGACLIAGCTIGLNAKGNTAKPSGSGITIDSGVATSTIGGNTAADRNVISGNSGAGIAIFSPSGGAGNRIIGNWIGLNAAGTAAIPNQYQGIYIGPGSHGNEIGGIAAGERNVLSGNKFEGVAITGAGADNNLIRGNYVGLNPAGNAAIPNQGNGVGILDGSKDNVVGGTVAGARNIIGGNAYSGVVIYGSGTTGNTILGNYVGLNAAGTAAVGNGSGVDIGSGASGNTIGGATTTARNVISGNLGGGTQLFDSAHDNKVQGNIYGANPSMTAAIGNTYSGVALSGGAKSNLIGGPNSGEGNVIVANGGSGVFLVDDLTSLNTIQGNWIGLTSTGVALRNTYQGVAIWNGPTSNTLIANTIANNSDGIGIGVEANKTTPMGNKLSQNRIYASDGLGINLYNNDGVTPNDTLDPDAGPNGLQNFPVLSSGTRTATGTTVAGTLNSRASRSYLIEVFSSDIASQFGNGEGQRYIGSTTVTTNASGNATFSFAAGVANGGYLTATATDVSTGDTSEFSAVKSIANGVVGLSLNPGTVDNGVVSVATVTLGSAAPTGGAVVTLNSNKTFATVPASATVAAGALSATFNVTTLAVPVNSNATITATYNGVSRSATLVVRATSGLKTLAVNPTYIKGSTNATGTVTLTAPAASGGLSVSLSETNAYLTTPTSVTVAAGNSAKYFVITTTNPPATQTVVLTATLGTVTKTVTLTIARQPKLIVFTFAPSSVIGGAGTTGTLKTDFAASTGGAIVSLNETASYLTTPTTVTIPAGSAMTNFAASTTVVATAQTATVTATLNGSSLASTLTVLPTVFLSSLSVTPNSVKGGTSTTGKATLNAAAPAGGAVITLSDNSSAAGTPASATVPVGALYKTFTITTQAVSQSTVVTVTGVYVGVTKTASLTVTP